MVQVPFKVGYLKLATWECVHFTTDSSRVVMEHIGRWPYSQEGKDWASVQACLIQAQDGMSLMDGVAQGLQFPSYFGRNWNATMDCLRDLSRLQFQSLVVVIDRASPLWHAAIVDVGIFMGIWLAAAEDWGKEGKPFHLVFCVD